MMQEKTRRIITGCISRFHGWFFLLLIVVACGLLFPGKLPSVETADAGKSALPLHGFVVALDPGHGGYDGGARAQDSGLWEKELTLKIALEAEKSLTAKGATVILTRREDICLSEGSGASKARKRADLQKRLDIALAGEADVFISIHLNEYRKRTESGPQVFYQQGGEKGQMLAGVLQAHMIRVLKPEKERKAMAGDYYVLRSRLPSALVECGFLSNSAEEKLLLSPDYHKKIALALTEGLMEYCQMRKTQTQ